jgi:hypothetical protein
MKRRLKQTKMKNKTLVVITKEQAAQIIETFGVSAVGLTSDGNYTTYQYRLDDFYEGQNRLSKTDDCIIER